MAIALSDALRARYSDDVGMPRYVTAVAETDTARGWRDKRVGAGVVLDITSGEAVCRGLTMPHSPRLRDGRLYVLNAGTGELGLVDMAAGRFHPLCFLPGFARGLAFIGDYALVGLSLPRSSPTFAGLPLEDRLKEEKLPAQCAVAVVNLTTGQPEHVLRLGGVVRELYDIAVLPDIRKPMLIGTQAGSVLNNMVTRGSDLPLSALA